MIKFTIGTYEVMAFAGKNQPVRLYLNDNNRKYRGYIDFIKDYAGTKNFILHTNGIVNAFMSLDILNPTLDILRNEKPVYFSANKQDDWAAINTGAEPTGEEEIRENSYIAQPEWV